VTRVHPAIQVAGVLAMAVGGLVALPAWLIGGQPLAPSLSASADQLKPHASPLGGLSLVSSVASADAPLDSKRSAVKAVAPAAGASEPGEISPLQRHEELRAQEDKASTSRPNPRVALAVPPRPDAGQPADLRRLAGTSSAVWVSTSSVGAVQRPVAKAPLPSVPNHEVVSGPGGSYVLLPSQSVNPSLPVRGGGGVQPSLPGVEPAGSSRGPVAMEHLPVKR